MVKAELLYNPYLLETQVSFNGNPPRINSLVEKYSGGKLQEWIDEVPRVFYDEMNGYDFELAFTGTDLDFEELVNSFARAGIGTDLVRLFHKGHIGSRDEKVKEIIQLLAWLDANANRRFDWPAFRDQNRELFEIVYPFVVIGDSITLGNLSADDRLFDNIITSIEAVEAVDELKKTDLSSTPILVVVDKRSAKLLPHNLQGLLNRNDVRQDQLFFLINYDPEKIKRVIEDLGVTEPHVVSSASDEQISRYFEIYPVSERIHDLLEAFRTQEEKLGSALEEENRHSEIANRSIHRRIKDLDGSLSRLRASSDLFTNKDSIEHPAEFANAKSKLMHEIAHWRAKKTKIDKIDDAKQLAQEYEDIVIRNFRYFQQEVSQAFRSQCDEIAARTEGWYKRARCDTQFSIDEPVDPPSLGQPIPPISSNLMEIKSEQYVFPKEGFLGKLFGDMPDAGPKVKVLETVFYCEKWRDYVEGTISPIADDVIAQSYSALGKRLDQLSDIYLEHISVLLHDTTEEKERVAAQLSEDEQLLQADNDWHSEFSDKLHAIERF